MRLSITTIILFIIIQLYSTSMAYSTEVGKASHYSTKCNGGSHTASGYKLVNNANLAAHKTLPFGTLVKVTNLKNGKSAVVKIVDRGPYKRGRIIDLTISVAEKLGFKRQGITTVKLEVVGKIKI